LLETALRGAGRRSKLSRVCFPNQNKWVQTTTTTTTTNPREKGIEKRKKKNPRRKRKKGAGNNFSVRPVIYSRETMEKREKREHKTAGAVDTESIA
jgi:hypothetical protein